MHNIDVGSRVDVEETSQSGTELLWAGEGAKLPERREVFSEGEVRRARGREERKGSWRRKRWEEHS